ncbi:MAG: choice-of-anchor Q domain-containing protein [Anaerolineaceae bacterium]|nr:choice-of-anchor Q domain-containing protein [Anaerolineaceae bacterium]
MLKKVLSLFVRFLLIVVFLVGGLLHKGQDLPVVHAANFWYVDASIERSGDGTSWATAFKNLQPAINAARAGDTIRVAQGVYLPTTTRLAEDPRTKSFILKDGVQILGGFLADTHTRDLKLYPTILSGDLDGNDINKDGDFINETWEHTVGNNAYSVVFGENLSNTSLLDGFIITGGFADNPDVETYKHGGGVHIKGGAPILRNLLISGNTALYFRHRGGGIWFDASAAQVEDSVISGNFGYSGGGLAIYTDSDVTIRNTIIRDNYSRGQGGGIFMWLASLELNNVKVLSNTGREGGGLDAYRPPLIVMKDVEFSDNIGGGISIINTSGPEESNLYITNGKFTGNHGEQGGALHLSSVNTVITNALFSGNYSFKNGGAIRQHDGTLVATNTTIAGNKSSMEADAAELWTYESVTFNNSIIWDNDIELVFNDGIYPVYNNCYQDLSGSSNPGFVNPLPREEAPTTAGDYHLTTSSIPQILNAGNKNYLPRTITTDLDGNPRFVGVVDLGPYELQTSIMGFSEFEDQSGDANELIPGGYFADFLEPSTFVLPINQVYDPFPPMNTNLSEIAWDTKGGVIYVDQDASGAESGASWIDAYTDLESALQVAQAGGQIWVAEGVYIPSNQTDPIEMRSMTFQLPNGVALYGGFSGTETSIDQRDWNTNPTILSGDLEGNDENGDGNSIAEHYSHLIGTNASHIVTAFNLSSTTVLDGFIVTGGMASSLVIGDGGSYIGGGGGVWIRKSSDMQLRNMQFYGNTGLDGGAVYAYYHTHLTVDNSIFKYNEAGDGAGIFIANDTYLTLSNSQFVGNWGTHGGAGIHLFDYSTADIFNALFEENTQAPGMTNPSLSGGAIMMYFDCQATIDRTNFLNNSAPYTGAIFMLQYNKLEITNSRLQGNDAYKDPGGSGGAIYAFNSDLDLVNVLISGNHAGSLGGAISTYTGNDIDRVTITMINSTIAGNRADLVSTASGIKIDFGELIIKNTIVKDPIAYPFGIGTFIKQDSITSGDVLFRNPVDRSLAPTSDGDYRLLPESPAINAGNNDHIPAGFNEDLAGGLRIQEDVVDIGAYEYQPVIYVDQNASGSNNGGSWQHAYTNLQDALLEVVAPQQIWVADGLYKPTSISDRTASFELKPGVHVFGGFAGTESDVFQRISTNPPSVLSGDLLGNDVVDSNGIRYYPAAVNEANSSENSYHVVLCDSLTERTILDGFTITAGHANVNTSLNQSGGGILVDSCGENLWMSNLDFIGNSAYRGGAVNNQASSPMMMQLDIKSNSAFEAGGGVYNATDSNPTIRESSFRGNTATYGGAIYNFENANKIVNSLISGNLATQAGGGVYNYFSSPEFTNVTLVSNYSGMQASGGGIYNLGSDSRVKFVNSILYGNLPTQYSNDDGVMAVTYSDVQGGHSGIGNITGNPLFINPGVAQDKPSPGGDYQLTASSPCIDTGLNSAVTTPIIYLKDLDGYQRIIDGDENGTATVDMGAYEYQQNTLTVEIVGNGEVTKNPNKSSYATGEEVTITATADPGWTFSGWSGDVTSPDNPLVITINGNTSLTATFTKNEYVINLFVDPEGKGSIASNPSGTYEYDQQVQLTATPEPGWQFKQWSGSVSSTNNPLTVTVTDHMNILAEFEKVGYTITVTIDPEGYGVVNLDPVKEFYALGEQVTLTAIPSDVWSFLGWSGDILSTQSSIVINVTGDMEFYADFGTPLPLPMFEVFLPLLTK